MATRLRERKKWRVTELSVPQPRWGSEWRARNLAKFSKWDGCKLSWRINYVWPLCLVAELVPYGYRRNRASPSLSAEKLRRLIWPHRRWGIWSRSLCTRPKGWHVRATTRRPHIRRHGWYCEVASMSAPNKGTYRRLDAPRTYSIKETTPRNTNWIN